MGLLAQGRPETLISIKIRTVLDLVRRTCGSLLMSVRQHTINFSDRPLTATKKNPGQSTLPGLLQLLPQLVGSYDLGGFGVSGDGDAAWIGPNKSRRIRENFPRSTYP
jgi:hypothetical protein